jgi:hypothetical protein
LPTGGWGYDHFPLAIRYSQQIDKNCLGMTGKFHTTWGEFGGYKHPNALIYETALDLAMGAKCSIGDQLHPLGHMDDATYDLIGKAYSRVEEREQWCSKVINIADIGLVSQEALNLGDTGDKGVNRILLEGKFTYNILDLESDFSPYKLLILPDNCRINNKLKGKLDAFVAKGGKLFCTGLSGLKENEDSFVYDLGAKFIGENKYNPDYIRPGFELDSLLNTCFIVYSKGYKIEATGEVLADRVDPYFNRTFAAFCSHQHTPYDLRKGSTAGITMGKDGIYASWQLFSDYATKGSLPVKEILIHLINKLLGSEKTIETNLPAQGITTLMKQSEKNRYINHILYAIPVKRGSGIEIIEDIPTIYDIDVKVMIPEKIKRVYIAPEMKDIPFKQQGNEISYKIDKHWCHTMVVMEY